MEAVDNNVDIIVVATVTPVFDSVSFCIIILPYKFLDQSQQPRSMMMAHTTMRLLEMESLLAQFQKTHRLRVIWCDGM